MGGWADKRKLHLQTQTRTAQTKINRNDKHKLHTKTQTAHANTNYNDKRELHTKP